MAFIRALSEMLPIATRQIAGNIIPRKGLLLDAEGKVDIASGYMFLAKITDGLEVVDITAPIEGTHFLYRAIGVFELPTVDAAYQYALIGSELWKLEDAWIYLGEIDLPVGAFFTFIDPRTGQAILDNGKETDGASFADLIERLNEELQKAIRDFMKSSEVGDIQLKAFDASELSLGWYVANGDRYPIDSVQGVVLSSFSSLYKAQWRITEVEGTINVPNLFHTDGRGLFLRPGTLPGRIIGDAIRNASFSFTPDVSFWNFGGSILQSSSLRTIGAAGRYTAESPGIRQLTMNFAAGLPTANEIRPISVEMTPAIFLGVWESEEPEEGDG